MIYREVNRKEVAAWINRERRKRFNSAQLHGNATVGAYLLFDDESQPL